MTLTNEQHAAITTVGNVEITVDGIECVLVRSDLFDRIRNLLGGDWTHDEMRLALAKSSKENGWEEPEMEVYDAYNRQP
ncbi:MAG TPA: hypothetical protein VGX78_11215 [Pirellulales bacterium]|jgi:hypothetical protein|nr:hypothetical protein [Pirellulales bacterium]